MDHELSLPPDPARVRQARRFVADVLARHGLSGDTVDSALICTSELVTNVLLHARSDVVIGVAVDGATARIEISDGSSVVPAVKDLTGPDQVGGHGLRIVQGLTDRWGVEAHDGGKTVWFELHDAARSAS